MAGMDLLELRKEYLRKLGRAFRSSEKHK